MRYYIVHNGKPIRGPFQSREAAQDVQLDICVESVETEEYDGIEVMETRTVPEWSYREDPQGWHSLRHVTDDRALFIEETTDGHNAGIYRPNDGGQLVACDQVSSFGEAICSLLVYAQTFEGSWTDGVETTEPQPA